MSNKRDARFWMTTWSPVALAAIVVTMTSTPYMSAAHTGNLLRDVWQALFGSANPAELSIVNVILRKSGHFFGYGTIGLAWLRAWRLTFPRLRFFSDAILAVLGTALLASCDEFHQSFLPSRTGSPWDVLLDCCGAAAMCLLEYAIRRKLRAGEAEAMVAQSSS